MPWSKEPFRTLAELLNNKERKSLKGLREEVTLSDGQGMHYRQGGESCCSKSSGALIREKCCTCIICHTLGLLSVPAILPVSTVRFLTWRCTINTYSSELRCSSDVQEDPPCRYEDKPFSQEV